MDVWFPEIVSLVLILTCEWSSPGFSFEVDDHSSVDSAGVRERDLLCQSMLWDTESGELENVMNGETAQFGSMRGSWPQLPVGFCPPEHYIRRFWQRKFVGRLNID